MLTIFEIIGQKTLKQALTFYKVVRFSLNCLHALIHPASYHPAARSVLIKQIYFTAVQILPLFIWMALLFGSAFIGAIIVLAKQYGLQHEIGEILSVFILDEFAPFFTAILLALRSGAAINTEIAVMSVNRELDSLRHYKIDLMSYLFVPRILGSMFSTLSLSYLFAILMLLSGYIFTLLFLQMDWNTYLRLLLISIHTQDIAVLTLKSLAFGFVITQLSIYSGLKTLRSYSAIPVSVLSGMVHVFIAIFSIEVVSLLLRLI